MHSAFGLDRILVHSVLGLDRILVHSVFGLDMFKQDSGSFSVWFRHV